MLVLSTHGSEHVTWAVLLSTFSYNRSAVVSWRKRVPLIRHFCHFLPYSTLSVLCGIFLTWIWDPVEGHVLRYTCHMVISMWLSAVNRSLASPWTCVSLSLGTFSMFYICYCPFPAPVSRWWLVRVLPPAPVTLTCPSHCRALPLWHEMFPFLQGTLICRRY